MTDLCQRCKKALPSDDGKHCLACRVALMPPLHTRLDLEERISVLEGLEKYLRARLFNAQQPQHMLEHVEHLEREAGLLYNKAQAIRAGVQFDVEYIEEIKVQLSDCTDEQMLLRVCRQRGWKVQRVQKMLARLRRLEKQNGLSDASEDIGNDRLL